MIRHTMEMRTLWANGRNGTFFYKHTEEIPKQINPTGLKSSQYKAYFFNPRNQRNP